MEIKQVNFKLQPRRRGVHLISKEVREAIHSLVVGQTGLLHLFIQHTSASLTINENADPTVRDDFEMALSRLVPENWPFEHDAEGPDDMPAHVKASLMGASVTLPIRDGSFNLGTWQGIYLCEHRNEAPGRSLVATLIGTASPAKS